jgi:hypothetical protein
MKLRNPGTYILISVLAIVVAGSAAAGEWTVEEDSRWCDNDRWDGDRFCEVREITLAAGRDVVRVDGAANGGISVEGWNRDEIRIQARVTVWTRGDEEDAREVIEDIRIETDGTIEANGPKQHRREGWSVSYRIMVPKSSNLELETNNGGISVTDVDGEIMADATNGGMRLTRLAGDVKARTTNGGLDVELAGDRWEGRGLDAVTTNGGVSLEIPETYNAELETGTVNGSVHVDFPITVQGRISKKIEATLGDGGARVRVRTTNGGVHLSRG